MVSVRTESTLTQNPIRHHVNIGKGNPGFNIASVERGSEIDQAPLWIPSDKRLRQAEITRFVRWLGDERGLYFSCYEELWQWSIEQLPDFWSAVWEYFDIPGERGSTPPLADERMPGARWFVDAKVNFVAQVFRDRSPDAEALIYETESFGSGAMTWARLERDVAALAATLRRLGVGPDDRVVAVLPNLPHTIIAFLATAGIGAIWSVCAPESGARSITERFRQIAPKILIACDGYRYGGKGIDRRQVLADVLAELPTVTTVIYIPLLATQLDPTLHIPCATLEWSEALAESETLQTTALPFDHPLWILYSSGTTGLPKAIIHSHGGILLTGLVSTAFHCDVAAGQRVLRLCSTAWMVWNIQVEVLLVGGTVCLFEGSPTGHGAAPSYDHLWEVASRLRIECFGAGAAYYAVCLKAGIRPGEILDLSSLQTLVTTGSPLSPDCYDWIYQYIKQDIWLLSVSGGTDICAPFLAGIPTLPVYRGELQCRVLGAAVYAFDDDGAPVTNQVAELVCTRPLPSMPLYFWNDPNNERYLESYFGTFTGSKGEPIWRHGDWLKLVPRPSATGAIIYGRSDATINRQGIRMGSGEFYRVIEAFDEIGDSLIIDLEYRDRDPYMVLFVVLRSGMRLDDALREKIQHAIRRELSPRHVPNDIVQIVEVPRTRSGKKLEVPIKRLLLGHPIDKIISRDALANPDSLAWFISFAQQREHIENRTRKEQ